MAQRGVKQTQSKMCLLLVRTSCLALLIGLIMGVAAVTAHRGITCRQEVPAQLIHELWGRTKVLINKLPKGGHFSLRARILPRFYTKGPEGAIGWLEMRELIDVYQKRVFSREVIQKLLPHHYKDLLHRLQHTLQHCVSSSGPSKHFEIIQKLEKKIKKRKRDEAALKAVGEFPFVLRWISELAQHHIL